MNYLKAILIPAIMMILLPLADANQVSDSQTKYLEKYKKQKTVPKAEDMLINTDKEPKLTKGFTPLFNGKDLTGWTRKGGKHIYEVKDGCIVGTCVQGTPNAFLCTDKNFADFIFTCEMKWEVDGNSGVIFRGRTRTNSEGDEHLIGPQCEMEGFRPNMGSIRGWSAGIYGEGIGGWCYPLWLEAHAEVRKSLKKDDWNRLTIKAEGDTVKTWLNGIPATHWKTSEYLDGPFGLQVHGGKQGTILWRNIKVREL